MATALSLIFAISRTLTVFRPRRSSIRQHDGQGENWLSVENPNACRGVTLKLFAEPLLNELFVHLFIFDQMVRPTVVVLLSVSDRNEPAAESLKSPLYGEEDASSPKLCS